MADRVLVWNGEVAQTQDILQSELNYYKAFGRFLNAVLGVTTQVNGFACTATSPASLAVLVAPGELYVLEPTDETQYGDDPPNGFAADPTPLMKQGVLWEETSLSVSAPGTPGQSVNYLVQIGFSEDDGDEASRQFYSSPVYRTVNQQRLDGVLINAKAGSPAATGSQVTPSPDAGYVGLWVVTVANGQTTVTSGNISRYAGTTFLTDKLKDKITFAQGDTRYLQLGAQPSFNFFINPIMNIFQATDALTLTSGQAGYCADMIQHFAGTSGAATVTKETYSPGDANVEGGVYYITHAQTTSSSTAKIKFWVENAEQFSGQPVVFGVICSSNTNINVGGAFTQNFGSGGSADVTGSSTSSAQQVTSGLTTLLFQYSIPAITGKTIGNVSGTAFALTLPTGTFELNIYGAGVFGGSTLGDIYSQGFDYDFQKCRRFYEKSYELDSYAADTTFNNAFQVSMPGGISSESINLLIPMSVPKPFVPASANISFYSPQDGSADNAWMGGSIGEVDIAMTTADSDHQPGSQRFLATLGPFTASGVWEALVHWIVDCRF